MLKGMTNKLIGYFKRNAVGIVILDALLLIVWGSWIINTNPRIDTELTINNPFTTMDWETMGRQGGLLTEYVFGQRWFNPYVATVFGYIGICLAGNLCSFVVSECTGKNKGVYLLCGIIVFSYPIFAELFYFDMMILKMAWAFILVMLASYWSIEAATHNSIAGAALSLLALIWAFSTYQAFILVYVAMVGFCYVFALYRASFEENLEGQQTSWLRVLIYLVAHFLLTYALYTLITNTWFFSSVYLESQIHWRTMSKRECVKRIAAYIQSGFMGDGLYHSIGYGILALITLLFTLCQCAKSRARVCDKVLLILAVSVLQIVPFLMNVYLGGSVVIRAQLSYAFVMMGNIMLLSSFIRNKHLDAALKALVIVLLWQSIGVTMRLEYTDDIRAQEDITKMQEIALDIERVNTENKPICFIGASHANLNRACLRGDLIGASFFEWDIASFGQLYCRSQMRVQGLANMLGIPIETIRDEQKISEAINCAQDMPVWPVEGAIVDNGEYIVVKIGY